MKRILSVALCLLLAAAMLVGCNEPKEEPHKHAYASDWTSDATNHWHASTCGHDVKASEAAHLDTTPVDGVCDVCEYVLYYTVTVAAPENVTVAGTLTAVPGADVTFTATVDEAYRLVVNGATVVSEAVQNGNKIYTCKVSALAANTSVAIAAEKIAFGGFVGEASGSIEQTGKITTAPITVTVPAAGTYLMYELADEEGMTVGMEFGDSEDPEYGWQTYYVFTAEAAGEVAVYAYLYDYEYEADATVDFAYNLIAIEDVILPALNGEGYVLPTNAFINVTVTLPAAGMYQMVASEGVAINDDLGAAVIKATEDALTVTVTVMMQDDSELSFDFDWAIEALPAPVEYVEGMEIVAPLDGYTAVSFTVSEAGNYAFMAADENAVISVWYESEEFAFMSCQYSNNYDAELEAGATIVLYFSADTYADEPADVETTIKVMMLGEIYESYTGQAKADADGVLNSMYLYFGGEYSFEPAAGVSYSFDGETWYDEAKSFELSVGYTNFYVKAADATEMTAVDFVVEEVVYELYPSMESTNAMVPGKTYNIYPGWPEAVEGTCSVTFTWDDEALTVYCNGEEITSGVAIEYDEWDEVFFTAVYAGEAETVTLTFTDNNASEPLPTLYGDEYYVEVDGQVFFYITINLDDGKMLIVDLYSETLSGLYNFAMVEGAPVVTTEDGFAPAFLMSVALSGNMTIQPDGFRMPLELIPVDNGGSGDVQFVLDGMYAINTPMVGAFVFDFWNGMLTITDNLNGTYSGSYIYSISADGVVTIFQNGENGENVSDTIQITFDLGGNPMFWCPDFRIPMALEPYMGGDEGGDEGGDDIPVVGAQVAELDVEIAVEFESLYADPCLVTFTAAEAGEYVLAPVAGETDAWVDLWVHGDRAWDYVSGNILTSYSFTLEAGESITFWVATWSEDPDTVNLIVTKA